ELDLAVNQREQRVVLSVADVPAGVKNGANLADDDRAGCHRLAAEPLDPTPLALGVASVAGGTLTFLMSHLGSSKSAFFGKPSNLPIEPQRVKRLLNPVLRQNLLLQVRIDSLFQVGIPVQPHAVVNLLFIFFDGVAGPPEVQLQRLGGELAAGAGGGTLLEGSLRASELEGVGQPPDEDGEI